MTNLDELKQAVEDVEKKKALLKFQLIIISLELHLLKRCCLLHEQLMN